MRSFAPKHVKPGSVFDTFGDKEKPLLQLRHDPRKTKSVKEFELTLAKAKLEWIAVPNAALLGVKFRLRVAANKFVVLSQHPKYKLTQIQQKEDETKIHQKEEMTMARQDKLIETLYDLVEQFTALSDKLDAKADLIQRRTTEAWRRANVPSAVTRSALGSSQP